LACKDEFFMKNPLDVKENEYRIDFALHLSRFFGLSWTEHPCTAHTLFAKRPSQHCQGILRTFTRFTQNLMHTSCRIHREISSGRIHNSK
jgi:hypothetical protein